ncbi:MAG TPA: TldD/PmbA family protein [Myxococcota bacterium]|nr:TldD/PmbA family protein [Myxococcota bacterium]HND32650.1 TldD/PmbA family protein [Myxococcota bacterium]
MSTEQLWELARTTLRDAQGMGAEEATVSLSRQTEVNLTRRAGRLEQATQATSLSLSLSLLVDDRFSGHSTSDLRPEALRSFLQKAVAATRALEPEPERRQPPLADCGSSLSPEQLDLYDPAWEALSIDQRRVRLEELEKAVDALPQRSQVLSATCYHMDSRGESVRVMSNGFEGMQRSTGYGWGTSLTLSEPGGRRPEATSWYSSNHLSELPGIEKIAQEAWTKAERRLGSGPVASGRYPMLLDAPITGRILGVLSGPLSGAELHQGRSFLAGKLNTAIGSKHLHLLDDPLIPRAPGSRAYDSDGLRAKAMPIVEDGVLRNYYIGVYYGRKLGMAPTCGGRSNWILRPGSRSPAEITQELPKCIWVTGFLGGNSNGLTGDFSFGIQGQLLEYGVPTKNLSEMNVSGNLADIFHHLQEPASDVWTWSSLRSPSLLFDSVDFSGL